MDNHMQHSSLFLKIVTAVKKNIREISLDDLNKQLQHKLDFTLIDVREIAEWEAGRLPAAIHLSKGVIERDIEKIIPDLQHEIILYCGGGSRSALAAGNVQEMGYTKVLSLQGGYRGWCQAGLQIVVE